MVDHDVRVKNDVEVTNEETKKLNITRITYTPNEPPKTTAPNEPPKTKALIQPSNIQPVREMWKCSKCTLLNEPDRQLCAGCYKQRPTQNDEKLIQCPFCTFDNDPSNHFCSMCAKKLKPVIYSIQAINRFKSNTTNLNRQNSRSFTNLKRDSFGSMENVQGHESD